MRKKLGPAFLAGLLIALVVGWARGLFRAADAAGLLRVLSDGFFAAGILLGGVGALTYCASLGAFDIFGYTFRRFQYLLRRDFEQNRDRSYYAYRQKSAAKSRSWGHLLLAGGVYLALALLFTFLFYSYTR